MTLLELQGEMQNPGKIGKVAVGEEHEACQSRPLVWARFIFVVIGLPIAWCFTVPHVPLQPVWQAWAAVMGATLIYVAIAYLLNPKPDMTNMGWAGGLMDDPTKCSDGVNRWLFQVKILLGPGRFVAESLADIFPAAPRQSDTPNRPMSEDEWNQL